MSPAVMYSLATAMADRYSSEVMVREAAALSSPVSGAASSSPEPGRAQSDASSRSRTHAAS